MRALALFATIVLWATVPASAQPPPSPEDLTALDPFATKPTADNEWVVTGSHLMLIVPDPALLARIPTDPSGGGPYVMWRDTPFVHVMIPVESGVVHMPQSGD